MTFKKSLLKKKNLYDDIFSKFYKFLVFDKILSCGRFWRYIEGPLNIFHILHESLFSLLIIISAAFHCDRDIKMSHSIFRFFLAILIFLHFVSKEIHDKQSSEILQKQDGSNIYAIMKICASFSQVHELPQNHCGDNREGTLFSWLHIRS